MRRFAPLAALALATCVAASEPQETTVSVSLSALSLTGVGDVLWDVQVRNGATPPQIVWSRRVASSRTGDGAGSATWVGPCDASPGAAEHTVDVWVVGLYDAPVASVGQFAAGQTTGSGAVTASPLPFVSPTTAGPLSRTATCRPNADTLVEFDVSIMRPARQGFFDVAVNLTSVFCSAKFDCCDGGDTCPADGSRDLRLLFDEHGERASTFVLGFACAAEPHVAADTMLYLDALQLDCTSSSGEVFSADLALDPSGPPGNQCTPGSLSTCAAVTELSPTIHADTYLYQLGVYRGLEALGSADTPLSKVYWNLALGVKRPAIGNCRLSLRGSADDAAGTPLVSAGRVSPGVVYPYIQWDVDLGTCGAEPLSFDGSTMVTTRYTTLDGPGITFAYGYGSGQTAGPFCDPRCVHGECVGGVCLCPPGYGGTACEQAPDPCAAHPCVNGVCTANGNAFTCACPPGFSGSTCADTVPPVDPCATNPCLLGECIPVDDQPFCVCPPNHFGVRCEFAITACLPNPCQNDGECIIVPEGFACDCPDGFGGLTCETELPCGLQDAPCDAGLFCTAAGVCLPDGTTPNETPVSVSPGSSTLLPGGTESFTLEHGNGPYTAAILTGGGELELDPDTHVLTFTAPDEPGSTTLRVTDAFGQSVDVVIDTTPPLGLAPVAVQVSSFTGLVPSGGLGPYTLENLGPGTLMGATYIAPSAPATTTIRITDAVGHVFDAPLVVHGVLAISPTTVQVATNGATAFSATGGYGTYTFSVSGGGSFSGSTYVAPATAGSATVTVTDQLGHTASASVVVYPPLVITPSAPTLEVNKTVVFSASGGQGAYTFAKTSGGGTLSGTTFTAPNVAGTAAVRVTDGLGNTRTATITIIAAAGGACASGPCLNGGICVLDSESETGYVCECVGDYSGEECEIEPPPCGDSDLPCDPGYFCTDVGVCLPDGTTPNPTPLAIDPGTATVLVSGTRAFSASGGNPPYVFYLGSGDGTVVGSTFTAPAYATTSTVIVRDAFGQTSTATVDVRPLLQISPAAITIAVNGTVAFTATGGVGTYTFTRPSGGGTLSGSTYTAPATTGTATVRVTDQAGNRSDATVTIASFAILPANPSVLTGGTIAFSASGGTAPYTYTVTSGSGSFSGSTYTAPATPGTATVRVTANNGWTASTTVTIVAPLAISPSPALVMAGRSQVFTTSGGHGAVTFSKVSGDGSLVGATFTAPATPGTAVIRATDTANNVAQSTVTIYPVLQLTPDTSYVLSGETVTFTATGGHGAHAFSVLSGGGSFDGPVYTASGAAGPSLVRVTDELGNTASAVVTVYGYTRVAGGGVATLTSSTTYGHSCGLRSDGSLWCWGSNAFGQIGDGTTVTRTVPVRIGAQDDWSHVATGDLHTCATRTDGTLWCWGYNANSRLGDGSTANRGTPYRIGTDSNWFAVAAGNTHTCAIKTTGTLWCWGANGNGQLGTGNTTVRTTPIQVGVVDTWSSVSATRNNATCATRTDGSLWCWGLNTNGVLGQGNTTQSLVPLRVSPTVTTWDEVAAGHSHVCATRTDGTLWCWGRNGFYQTGDASTTANRTSPFQVGAALGTWSQVAAGAEFSCATLTTGALYCWGRNQFGQVGDGSTTNRSALTRIGTATDWARVAAGPEHACASKVDGTLHCWGWNAYGQLGSSGTLNVVRPARVFGDATSVSTSDQGHSCATRTDGTLWCWGWNASYGMLGDGTLVNKTRPVLVSGGGTDWAELGYGFGRYHSCALRDDKRLSCWGRNVYGVFGNGVTTNSTTPVDTLGGGVWERASAGYYHTCGVRSNGTLWCWGYNVYGALGNGTTGTGNVSSPVQAGTHTTWVDVAAGQYYSCGLQANRSLWCWGRNNSYQLGDNTTTNRTSPLQIGTATWLQVAAGQSHTCGIQADGSLWCWGAGGSGRLGNGSTATQRVPVLADASVWSDVSVGYAYSCGVKADGSLWCWGANSYGQLGVGDTTAKSRPTRLGQENDWAEVSAGQYHSCARKLDGRVLCWGRNNYGQIGATDKCENATLYCQTNPEPVH